MEDPMEMQAFDGFDDSAAAKQLPRSRRLGQNRLTDK